METNPIPTPKLIPDPLPRQPVPQPRYPVQYHPELYLVPVSIEPETELS